MYIIWLPLPPPVNPIWVWEASPGPLTTHPIIDNVIGSFICASLSSKIFVVFTTSNPALAQDGQDIIFTPLCLKFKDFKISKPVLTSLTGSYVNEHLIVSPIPSINKIPIPIDDLMLPGIRLPASVIPRWRG